MLKFYLINSNKLSFQQLEVKTIIKYTLQKILSNK